MVIVEAIKAVYPQFKEEYKNKKREAEKAKRSKDIKNLIKDLGYEEAIEELRSQKEAAEAEPVEESAEEKTKFSKILLEELAYNGQVSAKGAAAMNEKIAEIKTDIKTKLESSKTSDSSDDDFDDDFIEVVEGEIVEETPASSNDDKLITPNFAVIDEQPKEVAKKKSKKKK